MKRVAKFQLGIETLLADERRLLRGKRVGLLAHPASVDTRGCHASVLLREACGDRLVALFGPEHGFYGAGGAGERIGDAKHPAWGIPIHSLYGDHRRPTEDMLRDLDTLVFDLQDIGVRCYTFVSTLRYVMEECARLGKTLIVCDRPVPLPDTVDGPMLDPKFESFVACVPMPLVYGMTPGEAARFLKKQLKIPVKLHVAEMRGWRRTAKRGHWGPWISPSPGIRYWETSWYYPATVLYEALPAVDYGRGSTEPFQVVTAPWIAAEHFAKHLNGLKIPGGVHFAPYFGKHPGVRMQVMKPGELRPFTSGLCVLMELQHLYGVDRVWGTEGTREDFFDKLAGTDMVRKALRAGDESILSAGHLKPGAAFEKDRRAVLLYS